MSQLKIVLYEIVFDTRDDSYEIKVNEQRFFDQEPNPLNEVVKAFEKYWRVWVRAADPRDAFNLAFNLFQAEKQRP